MSILGLDFGTHSASIAIWYEDKGFWEVVADDLGFRSIPCVVAFRGDENIVGHSALTQQHKNTGNTFTGIRNYLLKHDKSHVNVPLLEKDLTIQEINSIFFRNIHNQVKQQVGKIVREAVITTPGPLDEESKKKYIEAAQAGGIRIKSFLDDASAALLAYGLDDPSLTPAKTLVVDLGYSRSTVSLMSVSGGVFTLLASQTVDTISGHIFVNVVADFCAKEFTRKHKVPCQDNARAMLRLSRECENAVKALSTGAEASINIDSFCEGIDLSTKVSRARFEDLISIPLVHFKNAINAVLTEGKVAADVVGRICLAGGPSSVPRVINTLKALFANAVFPKVRFETYEVQCIGAVLHGKHLLELGLLENVPMSTTKVPSLTRSLLLTSGEHTVEIVPANSALPLRAEFPVQLSASFEGSLVLSLGPAIAADPPTPLGELVVPAMETADSSPLELSLAVSVEVDGSVKAEVTNTADKQVVASLQIVAA